MCLHPLVGAEVASLSAASLAYDAIALEYDEQVQGDAWMREVLHGRYRQLFRPGDRVLDVGCGTGIDALALARSGVRVVGVDASLAMIEQLRVRCRRAGLMELVDARVGEIEALARLDSAPFDGLIAAFASLSTLPDLVQFGDDAAQLVRPGGRMVLHLLNRFSLWEWLGYVSRLDWRLARQVGRLHARAFTIGGRRVPHRLYFADDAYRRFFAHHFARRGAYSLGSLRPPHTVRRVPGSLVNVLEWLDVRLGNWPLLRDAGRFFVLELERLPA